MCTPLIAFPKPLRMRVYSLTSFRPLVFVLRPLRSVTFVELVMTTHVFSLIEDNFPMSRDDPPLASPFQIFAPITFVVFIPVPPSEEQPFFFFPFLSHKKLYELSPYLAPFGIFYVIILRCFVFSE